MHETIRDMEEDFKKQNSTATDQVNADLRRMGVLKFDEMKIKEKFVFNPHTNEIMGFASGLTMDVLEKEIKGSMPFPKIRIQQVSHHPVSSLKLQNKFLCSCLYFGIVKGIR